MKTKTKTFDCVAMKRAAAAKVYRKTRGMTFQQEVQFWRRETEALIREQRALRARAETN